MPAVGCAKPMLTKLDGPNMPVIWGDVRKHLMNTSDILLWFNADGVGREWKEHSLSFRHSQLCVNWPNRR